LRVPRLGVTEVKGYLILLLAELAERRGDITKETRIAAESVILEAVRQSWAGGLTRKKMDEAYGADAGNVSLEIDLADQLASVMVSADGIAGNPRLIKRFLNNLMIRDAVAKAQDLSIAFDQLVKMQLFERCAPPAAFEYLVKQVAEGEDGKAPFIAKIEKALSEGESPDMPDASWDVPFVSDWLKLSPILGDVDLRPVLYLSRDRALSLASFDELSPEGRSLLEGLLEADSVMPPLVEQLKSLGEAEADRILSRVRRRARANQWDRASLIQALHIPKALPSLGPAYVNLLNEIPAGRRPAPLIPLIRNEAWAQELLKRWGADEKSPTPVKGNHKWELQDQVMVQAPGSLLIPHGWTISRRRSRATVSPKMTSPKTTRVQTIPSRKMGDLSHHPKRPPRRLTLRLRSDFLALVEHCGSLRKLVVRMHSEERSDITLAPEWAAHEARQIACGHLRDPARVHSAFSKPHATRQTRLSTNGLTL
jgi:hypothetical protein